ncbi:MAG: hypothetical protein WA775_10010 [Psychroserpens sp.]|uniref:hypothetical protein n=1 Tax=Psychroserpens sp. TaxID=2020870 RepID=UPI003CB38841
MKIFKLFFVAAVLLTMTACGNDDDGGSSEIELTNATLAGTYDITFLEGSSQTSLTSSTGTTVVSSTETYSGSVFSDAVLRLNASGTYSVAGDYVLTSIVTETGMDSETVEDIVTLNDSGSFTVNNEERTISFDGEVSDILLFDGTNLRLGSTFIEVEGNETETSEEELRLVKQE